MLLMTIDNDDNDSNVGCGDINNRVANDSDKSNHHHNNDNYHNHHRSRYHGNSDYDHNISFNNSYHIT